jgi:hypothetical protein
MFVVLDLCPVYPMLPVSQDCPFLIARSVFSNVCCPWLVSCVPYVASFSGLSISDCSFGRNGQSWETGNIGYTGHKSRTTNNREYRTSNQKWTILRNWQHRVHRTQIKDNKRQFLRIVHFWLLVRYSLLFVVLDLCPVYPMLAVSQDCSFLIARSVSSIVCCPRLVSCVPYVASFSGLSISDQKWTILRNWQHRVHRTQVKDNKQ